MPWCAPWYGQASYCYLDKVCDPFAIASALPQERPPLHMPQSPRSPQALGLSPSDSVSKQEFCAAPYGRQPGCQSGFAGWPNPSSEA